jgi:putative zinc finger protein
MTHAECQDLLLDLAYGELAPAHASELEAHLAGCEECRKEQAALEQVRRATAPLREVEEPPPGFDDRILEAARTQAALEHDGNLGQVIEVSGHVSPLGLEAARIDAHASPKARAERSRPRWLLRLAVGGSVAAAAAVALVVSTTVQSRRQQAPARADDFQIRVQPAAPQAVDTALREAEAKREAPAAPTAAQQPAPPPPAPEGERSQPAPAQTASRRQKTAAQPVEGSGGDAADSYLAKKKAAPAPEPAIARPAVPAAGVQPQPQPQRVASTDVDGPAGLESSAQQARHAGNYPLAAGLYRKAAALRRESGQDAATAAWDLAHAVECLAAVGLFDEAHQVRQDLAKFHPSEATALAAARRALREVDAPAADR